VNDYRQIYPTGYAGPQQTTLSKVLGLLGVAALFTAGGALAAPFVGRLGFFLGLFGGLGAVFALNFVKDKAPWNLVLLYAFATLEGLVLGGILESYLASGLGMLVLAAASATGVVVLIAGAYGYTTKRDLSRLGSILFIGLLALIAVSLIGLFVHLTVLQLVISAAGTLLFTGFLIFDLNRVARATSVTQGDAIMLAVSVYLDVFNLFLMILSLLGLARSRD
jgi:FtsH-binding integral membrane protein